MFVCTFKRWRLFWRIFDGLLDYNLLLKRTYFVNVFDSGFQIRSGVPFTCAKNIYCF